ncbi:TfpX/TfpZ family type IV pilin accessory protein [Tahibacter soli]|uniref:TfpX/TfpZ family type IV pilin accessory protein n=1 Tax=Tahibacter soli TaxID=2983605 RepID=A0A9X4BM00_9GAMM|nr:TfpX/TfpZ family type IV pilin accessory protein [Tahibacter soli]MDC8015822.1 TfpX/TfpZ family type IV pilin accessory protein [Tahibacter soli]
MTTTRSPMSRWKAASIHLLCSVALAVLAGALVFGLWFPPPYFHAAGGDRLVLILIGVDLVVGPLLTLIIFRSGKRGLRFDLACIGLVQVAALVYGLSIITASRPAFVVATIRRFIVVPANALDENDLAQAPTPDLRRLPWLGPKLISAQVPEDAQARNEIMQATLAGKDIDRLPKYYAPIEAIEEQLKRRAKPLTRLIDQNPEANRPVVEAGLKKFGRALERTGYMPLVTARGELVMLVDLDTGKTVGPLELKSVD